LKLSFAKEIKNNKSYYFITLNNRGLPDEKVSDLFHITLEEYEEILIATGGYSEDERGYIFSSIEDIENALTTLKILLDEP